MVNAKNWNQIGLTEEEYKRFNELKYCLNQAVSPGYAKLYKQELDSLIAKGRSRIIKTTIRLDRKKIINRNIGELNKTIG